MIRLQQEIDKHPIALRRQFERLDDKQKLAVMLKFIRHARACDASGCETDPHFLLEVIGDVKRGLEV